MESRNQKIARKQQERRDLVRNAFQTAFDGEAGRIVLAELAQFTDADKAPFRPDARAQDYMQGRRSVYCEIIRIINSKEVVHNE